MPSFVAHGPLVPDELVQDLEDDRVVLFCGAGISRGAGLPDYNGLVRDTYEAIGVAPPSKRDHRWLWPDRMLGELESKSQRGAVRAAVAEILGRPPRDVDLHRALLRLSKLSRHPGLRLVTTNFDTYFEQADPTLRPGIDLHSGPVLPIPRDDNTASWRSVVYLHGRLEPPPHGNDHLIVTSADFGRAYLTDGWAARFVSRLFADFSVLFVGYSLNDPVLRYMTDAFAAEALAARRRSARPPAYIFVSYKGKAPPAGAAEEWQYRGLEPIFYHHKGHHRLLRETVVAWAAARDDWLSSTALLVERLASSPPQSLTPSDVANVLWAIFGRSENDGYGARVFADLEPVASIDWLQVFQKRETDLLENHATAVKRARLAGEPVPPEPTVELQLLSVRQAGAEPLTATSFQLARWLSRHLNEDAAIDWVTGIAESGRRPHPHLRDLIRRRLDDPNLELSVSKRRFWRIASSEALWLDPGNGTSHALDLPTLMREAGNEDLFRAELMALLRPYIRLSPSTWRIGWEKLMGLEDSEETPDLEDRFSRLAEAEVDLVGRDQLRLVFDEFDTLPEADDLLAGMTDDLTSTLKLALDLWALVSKAGSDRDPSQYHQPSIVPHEQNQQFHHWTILIELLWRAWRHIDAQDCNASRCIVDRWLRIDYPTFQRMALAAIGQSACWTSQQKLEALLNGL
ncbi:hypothetical protein GOB36_30125 [Sinorhizobium meliloti]|nr:hypothetical protein [Sinorhizobium meliloti]